jgi:phosphoribosyl 1,2-cyclic phosphate phosphodiesterase
MKLVFTILGCGSSAGVPRVGQGWGACDPANPRNRRRRCSLLIEQIASSGEKTIVLVDTSPDLREQLLAAEVDRLDAILITHPHADHTHGVDDVRPLVQKAGRRIDIFMDEATSRIVRPSFNYIFETPPGSLYEPLVSERRLRAGEPFRVEGPGGQLDILPFRLEHGEIDALGFRVADVAYSPDLKAVPSESERHLAGLGLWIVDALRYTDHSSHLSVADSFRLLARFKPHRAILTDLSTELDYQGLLDEAPPNVDVAYDGMRIEFAPSAPSVLVP